MRIGTILSYTLWGFGSKFSSNILQQPNPHPPLILGGYPGFYFLREYLGRPTWELQYYLGPIRPENPRVCPCCPLTEDLSSIAFTKIYHRINYNYIILLYPIFKVVWYSPRLNRDCPAGWRALETSHHTGIIADKPGPQNPLPQAQRGQAYK